jgi:hypothetical protein
MKKIFFLALILSVVSCKKVNLDGLGFPSESLTQYEFDAYADPEIEIADSFKINSSNYH